MCRCAVSWVTHARTHTHIHPPMQVCMIPFKWGNNTYADCVVIPETGLEMCAVPGSGLQECAPAVRRSVNSTTCITRARRELLMTGGSADGGAGDAGDVASGSGSESGSASASASESGSADATDDASSGGVVTFAVCVNVLVSIVVVSIGPTILSPTHLPTPTIVHVSILIHTCA